MRYWKLPALLVCVLLAGCAADATAVGHAHDHRGHTHGGAGMVGGGTAKVSFAQDVAPALRQHCAGCHSGPTAASGLAFFDAAGAPVHATVERHAGLMLLELQTGRMPPDRPYAMPSDQFRLLDVWAASGAPDN